MAKIPSRHAKLAPSAKAAAAELQRELKDIAARKRARFSLGTVKAIAEARASLAQARAAQIEHLAPATRLQLLSAADHVARELDAMEGLSHGAALTCGAALNLQMAAARLEAAANVPEDWGGLGFVVEALQLRAAAEVQIAEARREHTVSARHGKTGGRPRRVDLAALWAKEFDSTRSTSRNLTAQEIYEDIASTSDVKWTTVRDQISKHRRGK